MISLYCMPCTFSRASITRQLCDVLVTISVIPIEPIDHKLCITVEYLWLLSARNRTMALRPFYRSLHMHIRYMHILAIISLPNIPMPRLIIPAQSKKRLLALLT